MVLFKMRGGIFVFSKEELICVHLSGVFVFTSTTTPCLFIFLICIRKGDPKFVEKRGNFCAKISILNSSFGGVKIDYCPENGDDIEIKRAAQRINQEFEGFQRRQPDNLNV